MAEYIERETIKAKKIYCEERHEYVVPVAEIDWLPAADVASVEHGQWISESDDDQDEGHYYCSACKSAEFFADFIPFSKYCSNCGAKIDGSIKR